MSAENLRLAYREATRPNGLIALTATLRDPTARYNQKRNRIAQIFNNLPLWIRTDQADGHATYKHELTGRVVGFQAHGNNNMDPSQVANLLDNVQDHLNYLHNVVFDFKKRGWHVEPNYEAALERYLTLNRH